jgi:hypothetical protein
MKLLLKKFPIKIIGSQGNSIQPHTIFALGIKSGNEDKFKIICHEFIKILEIEFPQNKPSRFAIIVYKIKAMIKSSFDNSPPVTEYSADIEDDRYNLIE